jgi:hypothetical protein
MFLQENMDIKDGVTTSSKEQLRSPIRVWEHDEITPKGGKDWSVTKEHPWGLKRRRLNFMWEDPPCWTRGWHCQNGAIRGAKCKMSIGPTCEKGRPNRAEMGLGRSASPAGLAHSSVCSAPLFLEREDDATLSTWRHRHSQRESHSPERPSKS